MNFINVDYLIKNVKQKKNFYEKNFKENKIYTKSKTSVEIKLNKIVYKSEINKFLAKSYEFLEEIKFDYKINENIETDIEALRHNHCNYYNNLKRHIKLSVRE